MSERESSWRQWCMPLAFISGIKVKAMSIFCPVADAGMNTIYKWKWCKLWISLLFFFSEAFLTTIPPKDAHVQLGSSLELTCVVSKCPFEPLISWTKKGRPIKNAVFTASRDNDTLQSKLKLSHSSATADHSGVYLCTSTCTSPVNVTVHVLRGKMVSVVLW